MLSIWKRAESTESPVEKEILGNGVFLRKNIVQVKKQTMDGEKTYYQYDEAYLQPEEYNTYEVANIISDNISLKHDDDVVDSYTLQLIEEGIL